MRHADLPRISRSVSFISRRLVAQYSDVPSVARTRNALISPKPLSHTERPIAAAQCAFRYHLQTAAADSDLPVRFQPGQKMPAQSAAQLQVLNRRIPTIETNKLRIESAFKSLQKHFRKMVVFCFPVAVACQRRDSQPAHSARCPSRAS